ncbi:MAG: MotA/TolQ/ExbB proton channel family protein, partial [Elusimicrobiota bacterium]
MKKQIIRTILLSFLTLVSAKERNETEYLERIEKLKAEYQEQQDMLEDITEKRWSIKKGFVKQKERDSQSINELKSRIERLYSDIGRIREEVLMKENVLESEKKTLEDKKEMWNMTIQVINEKYEKSSEANFIEFPIGQEKRTACLNKIKRDFPCDKNPIQYFNALMRYRFDLLKTSSSIGLSKSTVLPSSGAPVEASILRVGHGLAYALSYNGEILMLGKTGSKNEQGFSWEKVKNSEAFKKLVKLFPVWIEHKQIKENIPIDILQNEYSNALLAGKEQNIKTRFVEFAKSGGPVLIPLAVIIIWAAIIIINRIIFYTLKHARDYDFINKIVNLLESRKIQEAKSIAGKKRNDVLSRILSTCLNHPTQKRPIVEKSIKELLLNEVPSLEKHLDTLAVLAAAAPLLGLLGTVMGMIELFEVITRFGTGDPKIMAGGISEALITTQVGLSIAIPILFAHNFLRNRRNHIQADMERYA